MKKAKKNNSKFITVIRWLSSISILAVLLWVMYLYAGKLLCHIALGQIGEFTNTRIKAGSIKYMANGSVLFTDFVVNPCQSPSGRCEIIHAKRLFARFNKKSLFLLKPRVEVLDINDFVFNAVYDVNSHWSNLSQLKIKPTGGGFHKAPDIHLGSGKLQYIKIIDGNEEVALSVPVDADFKSDGSLNRKYNFDITTATMSSGYGLSRLNGSWEHGKVEVTGGVASLSVPKFEMAWYISVSAAQLKYDKDDNYSLVLSIRNMQSLRNSEPNALNVEIPPFAERYGFITATQNFLDTYRPKGLVDIDLKMSGNMQKLSDSTLDGTVHCRDIAFNYSRFPYEIKHLTGDIHFTHDSIAFDNLVGKHNDSELSFSGSYKNFGKNREYEVNIASDKLPLGDDLYTALSVNQQEFWSSFSPEGNISIDLQVKRTLEGGRSTNLKVGLLDVDAIYDKFPYPLKNLSGELLFDPDGIEAQKVFSKVGDKEIEINGEINERKKEVSPYNFVIDVNNVPMDSTLETAMLKSHKQLYSKLEPSGLAGGSIRISGSDANDMEFSADMNFKKASMKVDFLSNPLTGISAKAILTPNKVVINKFFGNYGDMPIVLTGKFMSEQEQQLCYDISLDMKKVRLNNKELQNLLPDSVKSTVEHFDPNGMADMILDLKKLNPEKPIDYSVNVNCLGNSIYLENYKLYATNVTGLMDIDSNNVRLTNVSACLDDKVQDESKREKVFLNGDIHLDNGVMKQAELNLSANNILFDDKFINLLPPKCQNLYKTLSPGGTIDINFNKFNLLKNNDGINTIDFTGEVNLANCDFVLSDKPAKLNSTIMVQGKYDSSRGFCDCNLYVDKGNLNILGKNLADLKTKVSYDPNEQKWASDYFLADLYGGKTTGQLELIEEVNTPAEYIVQIAFDNVDLKRFLSDSNNTEENTAHASGKMSGSISLSSQVPQNNSRIGSCRVMIKNMQIGKMSPIAQLLQVLNMNEPSEYAFDSMFLDSYIKRDGLVVEKLDMSGKSVAFYGSGLISLLNGDMNLSLTARGRRSATDDPSVFQSLTEALNKAVIRMDVTGNYHDIKVETKTLPVIESTFQIFGKPVAEN